MRFVALGDSITVGMGDPMPDGSWRGWARLLADALPATEFHNLAAAGALTADVERAQLPRALELRPDLAAVIVGVNDTLRGTFDPTRIAASYAHTLGALRATGAPVLTMRLPDPGLMFGLPGVLARPLGRRVTAVNRVLDALADRFGTLHFDAAGHPETYDRRMWSIDRLHPSERGHRMVAGAYHDLLAAYGVGTGARPDPEPTGAPPTRRAQLHWMATKGTRWLMDRSHDLVPYLLRMALAEMLGRNRDDVEEYCQDVEPAGLDAAGLDVTGLDVTGLDVEATEAFYPAGLASDVDQSPQPSQRVGS
ncbi:MAG: SGNH/GDSL hydrolase family protein [Micromonosporaceae bacterium]|nr:SGNH/GDSL hydrolase family protein [Micromonosporaceae bacterium]